MPLITTKYSLSERGRERMELFCETNEIDPPKLTIDLFGPTSEFHTFDTCGYYRKSHIHVCPVKCANVATEAQVRNWNWPGSTTDREPFGVICHELGHHCDWLSGSTKYKYSSEYSVEVMKRSGEKPITSYCPNPAEWFAEMFRVFVTNAALLKIVRPKTYSVLLESWMPVSSSDWRKELGGNVPDRILKNLERLTR